MPEVHFIIRWPDKSEERCYSPSTVVTTFLEAGTSYPLEEFLARTRTALRKASDRVAEKYGFACNSALDQLEKIENQAQRYSQVPQASVTCIAFEQ
ncbi:MSMEG_0570 family nitrogen starvation response protein [Amaricoccus macauensis]|uniref:MSMEG_0570 family nitrogen starvation response protein n=1 Tax=Amaricoccus macauensis TaxID=57001 RepID=UPI003C7B4BCB